MTETVELDALDRIALEAQGSENEAQAVEDAILNPDAGTVIDPAQTWAQIPAALGGLLAIAMPELKNAYTEANCLQWGAGMAAVSEKYGWDAGETISKWTPEFMLIMATVPLLLPTIQAVQMRRAAADTKPQKKDADAVAGPENKPFDMNLPEPGGFVVPT